MRHSLDRSSSTLALPAGLAATGHVFVALMARYGSTR
jgi:hypothetical protein